jgi:L,D-peptidoglycan transpeptidase YkuD (ErfK/YbiS/YcfS/YnhG family)
VLTVLVAVASGGGCAGGVGSPGGMRVAAPSRPAAAPPAPRAAPARDSARAGRLAGRQLVTVTAAGYGSTYATLAAYRRSHGRWRRVLGPWTARIGRNGFAPPSAKREGDGRTPSGTFGIQFFFGVLPDPGVKFRYRRIHPYDYWDDDPASVSYNRWVDVRHASAGASPEPMDVPGYDYGLVIGYNTARTPGLGSAIFLHVNIGIATAGCVTLPAGELLAVLRWLDPARSPRIRMGVR